MDSREEVLIPEIYAIDKKHDDAPKKTKHETTAW
jgi:hypothetical protein